MIRDSFYYSKTTCFAVVEGLSFTVKYHSFITKTTCFTIVIYSDIDISNITLTNNLTLNMLEVKVTLKSKSSLQKVL